MRIICDFFKKNKSNYSLLIGGGIILFILLVVLIGTVFPLQDPNAMDSSLKLAGPMKGHIFGCDNFGRDLFARLIVGARTTLFVATGTVLIGTFLGIVIGAFCGYYGGFVDEILMRFSDAVLAFPSILLALVFISVFGSGTYQVMFALGIVFAPSFARIMRGEFLREKNLDYVRCAKLVGATDMRVMFVHILPNTVSILFSSIVIGFNNAVLAEAGMSFLGIGVQLPQSSLGMMLSDAQSFLFTKPGYAFIPGITISLLILGFSLLGEGLKKVK